MIFQLPLQDNFLLSYAEYGSPQGRSILVQHGMVASILDGHIFRRLIDSGMRVICPARPGYGRTSPVVLENIAAWNEPIAGLVQALNLASFDILGISSGAPYSYAIAQRFPERVGRVFILGGTPALYDDSILSNWPYPVDKQASLPALQRLAHDLFFSDLSSTDLARDDIRDSMMNDCFGIALDLKLRCRSWGFRLEHVRAPVLMRHSQADDSVPLITARMTAALLPDCSLQIRENDPHFSQSVLDDFMNATILAPSAGVF